MPSRRPKVLGPSPKADPGGEWLGDRRTGTEPACSDTRLATIVEVRRGRPVQPPCRDRLARLPEAESRQDSIKLVEAKKVDRELARALLPPKLDADSAPQVLAQSSLKVFEVRG